MDRFERLTEWLQHHRGPAEAGEMLVTLRAVDADDDLAVDQRGAIAQHHRGAVVRSHPVAQRSGHGARRQQRRGRDHATVGIGDDDTAPILRGLIEQTLDLRPVETQDQLAEFTVAEL